ncbi:MFS transporter [Arsenicicoccus sp. oral taxon 190]|uniref:MFS transporter n=1 Tax=Arsenicicoccus sp. oral taxon 190 TaxID=1658671 RepID=UPI00067A1705|nr:MFS transporter [Arsenicicoccus sp. oral taxon 190]AKT51137.1 MFS transporter [Arsenicicoccus sp. oral taxon 190]
MPTDQLPPGHLPGSAAYRRISVALFLAGLATFAMIYTTQPLLPELARAFRLSPAAASLSVSTTTFALGIAMLLVGPSSEVLGRTRVMHLSLFASSLVTVLTALAPTWPVLLVLRTLLGVAVAGLPAVAVAYLREEVDPSAAARAAGLYIGGTALGGMAGRFVTGGVADLAGWHWAIASVGLLGLGCAVTVRLMLPPSRKFAPTPLPAAELVAMTRRMATDPALLALYGIAFCTMGAFVSAFNAMGFRLARPPYSLSLGVAGLVFAVYALGSVASARAGRLADLRGVRAVVPVTLLIYLAGLAVTLAVPLWLVVAGLAVVSMGFFATHGVASGWVASRATYVGRGTAQATSLYMFAYYLGSSVCGTVAGAAWSCGGWPLVVAWCAGLVLVAAALAVWLRRVPTLAR